MLLCLSKINNSTHAISPRSAGLRNFSAVSATDPAGACLFNTVAAISAAPAVWRCRLHSLSPHPCHQISRSTSARFLIHRKGHRREASPRSAGLRNFSAVSATDPAGACLFNTVAAISAAPAVWRCRLHSLSPHPCHQISRSTSARFLIHRKGHRREASPRSAGLRNFSAVSATDPAGACLFNTVAAISAAPAVWRCRLHSLSPHPCHQISRSASARFLIHRKGHRREA